MKQIKKIKELIKNFDFFAQPVTFRYAQEQQYESFVGGIVSIILIIVFSVIFSNVVLNTMNRIQVDGKTTYIQQQVPSLLKTNTNRVLFAIGVNGLDLNEETKWFEFVFEKKKYQKGKSIGPMKINLVKCTKERWVNLNPEMNKIYDQVGLDKFLCPPQNTDVELEGRFSSDIFKFYRIGVRKCQQSPGNKVCASQESINNFLQKYSFFTLNFYTLNVLINPQDKQYTKIYFDESNFFTFTLTMGTKTDYFVSNFEVTTDESIGPFQQNTYFKGIIAHQQSRTLPIQVKNSNQYLKIYIRKSSLMISVNRSYRKIDDMLSFIGGLFSSVLIILRVFSKYNQLSYELEVAENLFHFAKNRPLLSAKFNFFVFLGYVIYSFFDFICIKLPWKVMEKYQVSLQQVRKQMDIRLVMKKILYAERMGIAVFKSHKAKILHLQEPLTLEEAAEIRKDYRFYQKLEKKYFDYKKIRQKQKQQEQKNKCKNIHNLQTMRSLKQPPQKQKDNKMEKSPKISMIQQKQNFDHQQMKGSNEFVSKKSLTQILKQKIYNTEIQKQKQMQQMIDKMKEYIYQLREEVKTGDIVSKNILNRFDQKLLTMFVDKSQDIQSQVVRIDLVKDQVQVRSGPKISEL